MAFPVGPVVRLLSAYRGYRCRHSGVCCTAGWDIAIGGDELARMEDALAAGSLVPPGGQPCVIRGPDLPAGAAGILCRTRAGDCVFFDRDSGRLCAIQRAAGHGALPSACRHFPRVILAEDDGLSVAFSHVCPTAAEMLIDGDGDDLAIVEERGGATPDRSPELEPEAEGFDARGTVPPFVRPGVVFDRASWRAWETFLVEACNRDEAPEAVLARIARGAEALRAWTPAKGEMAAYASDVFTGALDDAGHGRKGALAWSDAVRLSALVAECVRPGVPQPPPPEAVEPAGAGRAWNEGARVARRYLAARAFGAWSAYLGDGVRTQVAMLAATLAVLRIEAGSAAGGGETLSGEAWRGALGRADRLVVHQVDDAEWCRSLGIVESMPAAAFMEMLGVGGA